MTRDRFINRDTTSLWLRLKAGLVWLLVRALLSTVRMKVLNLENLKLARKGNRPILYAFWHGRQLLLFKHRPEKRLMILASRSRDGALQSDICRRFGIQVVRGSSSRGGLLGMIMLAKGLRYGLPVGMAVDGPRGPAFKAKPGIVALARQAGSTILPVSVGMRRCWELTKTWDRFQIPRPFTRAIMAYGKPMFVPKDVASSGVHTLSERLSEKLNQLTCELDQMSKER